MDTEHLGLVILGGGPAGLSAARYRTRLALERNGIPMGETAMEAWK